MANDLYKDHAENWTWTAEQKIWTICCDWNRDHEDEEIFMCETSDDDDNVNGFMIEDDLFYDPNRMTESERKEYFSWW
jgi:hypothetical protein